MDFIVSIRGVDNPETQEMIHVLNVVTSVWGRDATTCMLQFLNLVKSKTDELAVTLHHHHGGGTTSSSSSLLLSTIGGGGGGSHDANDDSIISSSAEKEEPSASVSVPSSSSSSGKAVVEEGGRPTRVVVVENESRKKSEAKAKLLESEKKVLEQRLKESEANLASAQKEIKELKKCASVQQQQQSKRDSSSSSSGQSSLSSSHAKTVSSSGSSGGKLDLDMLLESYNNRCIELDNLRDESIRHSMWFSEQNSIYTLNKQKLENRVHEKEKLLKDLEKEKEKEKEKKTPHEIIDGGFLPSGIVVREVEASISSSSGPSSSSQLHLLLRNLSKV